MNTLPRYAQGATARFDFRVPDGIGHWVYPDWDDVDLKVEFHDSGNTLRATATVAGEPALTQGDDHDENNHPDGGAYVMIEGLDLADFALGVTEARVYAKVDDVEVLPYPSVVAAFEVVAGVGEGPLYSTVERVQTEVPGAWPDSITEEMITLAIHDAGRMIDAFLQTCYQTPFADVADVPATPASIENICRKLAAHQCMEWMGRVNAADEKNLGTKAMALLLELAPTDGKTPTVRLEGYQAPLATYRGDLTRSDDEVQADVLT